MNGLLKEGITLGWKATQCQLGCKLETVDGRKSSWIWSIKLVCRWTLPSSSKWHQVKLDNVQWTPNLVFMDVLCLCVGGLVSFSKVLAIFPLSLLTILLGKGYRGKLQKNGIYIDIPRCK